MSKCYIFGAGDMGIKAYNILKHIKYNEILFCDNDERKHNTEVCGCKVCSFEEMRNDHLSGGADIIIAVCGKYRTAIFYQCICNGIDKDIIQCLDANENIIPYSEIYSEKIYSQDGEEIYLKEKFRDKRHGVYIDIGAHHPYRFSNTYWAYEKGWHGLNIEPDVMNYKLLLNIRDRDKNINCGISDCEGEIDYYQFEESALNTFCFDQIKQRDKITSIKKVPVKRLDTLIRSFGVNHIDFIDIDVEGMEMQVLKSIDWNETKFTCILVEQLNLDLKSVLESEVCIFLEKRGYVPKNKFNRTVIYEKIGD